MASKKSSPKQRKEDVQRDPFVSPVEEKDLPPSMRTEPKRPTLLVAKRWLEFRNPDGSIEWRLLGSAVVAVREHKGKLYISAGRLAYVCPEGMTVAQVTELVDIARASEVAQTFGVFSEFVARFDNFLDRITDD